MSGPGKKEGDAIKVPAKGATVLSISFLNDNGQKVTDNHELVVGASIKTRGFKINVLANDN